MTLGDGACSVTADVIFSAWLRRFSDAIESRDPENIVRYFAPDGYWKDILSFTWEHRNFFSHGEIAAALRASLPCAGPNYIRLSPDRTPPRRVKRAGRPVIEGYFDFDTRYGRGTGFVRLLDEADPRIWLMLTTLQELRGFEEKVGRRRPTGDEYAKNTLANNWLDDRLVEQQFADRDPQVLIVGAGHAGLILAARLRQIGVDALIVDKLPRVGDVWRQRYHSLTLHNEVTANHMPYMPFPETWPVWLPKDMLATWLENYAEALELNVWTSTELMHVDYDPREKVWTAQIRRADGSERVMHCRHLVAAIGVSGSTPNIPSLPGLDEFTGTLIHSSDFKRGQDFSGKSVVVVGTGNSGHDVAQDLYVHDAEKVWMLQRGPTCVASLDPSAKMVYSIYNEGLPVDDVDLITASVPYPVMEESYRWLTKKSANLDKPLLDRLNAVGFETFHGDDDTGFQMMYLRGKGGYYINVGCSELIADDKIGVLQIRDVDRFVAGGLKMQDGTLIACDVVILATGFKNMQEGIRGIVGDKIAERVGPIWGFDDTNMIRNMWRRTAQENFWITGGTLIDSRLFSRFLAIEIKAALEGLLPEPAALPLGQAANKPGAAAQAGDSSMVLS